ncbi:unnamed protein product [Didymodactylos carnosus]|uniref:RING-type domain-containing protein n=1 Tax=Didymodactylos carnosus TaxID=1234261 RepID=A0A814MS21_9BILA|nr:unnamed protein product [Didymodactylos carnosus]CAF1082747.1 unnamed protein product [Didymodactylos carnosus]CAF3501779.1 unnamed protein product [Didymodactylos carnosus]CAF3848542.1 unnamed protein product [Didymodactylos carnosus]
MAGPRHTAYFCPNCGMNSSTIGNCQHCRSQFVEEIDMTTTRQRDNTDSTDDNMQFQPQEHPSRLPALPQEFDFQSFANQILPLLFSSQTQNFTTLEQQQQQGIHQRSQGRGSSRITRSTSRQTANAEHARTVVAEQQQGLNRFLPLMNILAQAFSNDNNQLNNGVHMRPDDTIRMNGMNAPIYMPVPSNPSFVSRSLLPGQNVQTIEIPLRILFFDDNNRNLTQMLTQLFQEEVGVPPNSQRNINQLPDYKITDDLVKQKASCAICLDEFDTSSVCKQIQICRHIFHTTCLTEWLLRHGNCPVCRTTTSPNPHSAQQERLTQTYDHRHHHRKLYFIIRFFYDSHYISDPAQRNLLMLTQTSDENLPYMQEIILEPFQALHSNIIPPNESSTPQTLEAVPNKMIIPQVNNRFLRNIMAANQRRPSSPQSVLPDPLYGVNGQPVYLPVFNRLPYFNSHIHADASVFVRTPIANENIIVTPPQVPLSSSTITTENPFSPGSIPLEGSEHQQHDEQANISLSSQETLSYYLPRSNDFGS